MIPKHYDALIKRLVSKSEAGTVGWSESPTRGVFLVDFSDTSIRVSEYADSYGLAILDESGEVVDSLVISTMDPDHEYAKIRDLYNHAKRSARNVDAKIAKLLEHLDEGDADNDPPPPWEE